MSFEIHPAADEFPMFDTKRMAELVEDIRTHGQREPIKIYQGKVIDGRNRLKACEALGITPRTVKAPDDMDPWAYVWSLNGARRDLVADQRAQIWIHVNRMSEEWKAKQAKVKEEAAKKMADAKAGNKNAAKDKTTVAQFVPPLNQKILYECKCGERFFEDGIGHCPICAHHYRVGTQCSNCYKATIPKTMKKIVQKKKHESRSSMAAASHTNKGAIQRAITRENKAPEIAAKVRKGEIKPAEADKQIKKAEAEAKRAEALSKISNEKKKSLNSICDLRVCSCRELFESGIKPDAVITDPPYPEEFLPVFSELAEACAKAKVPLVAVMSGQTYLPDVLRRLCEHLEYRWTISYLTPGGQAVQQWPRKVNAFWKPIFLFGKSNEWIGDVATSKVNDNDKRFHDWGQSESGMADLVERLTKPGQLVCDPFLGGGTTGVVSIALGRRFVGCDIDESSVEKSRDRIEASLCEK